MIKGFSFSALFTIILLFSSCPTEVSQTTGKKAIFWTNPEFENAVRMALEIPYGAIYPHQTVSIKALDLSDKNLTIIDNLVHFPALRELNLNSNNIIDIRALTTSPNLTALDLGNNQITDISFLSELRMLWDLDLRDNHVTDWKPVEHVLRVLGRPAYIWATTEPSLDGDTYQIISAENLAWLVAQGEDENFVGKTIKFMNDIDMENTPFEGIPRFAGIMDGQGYKITNLHIYRPKDTYVGLVRYLESGEIKNLTIESGTITGNDHVGAFVGVARMNNNDPSNKIPVLSGLVNKAEVNGLGIVGGIIGATPDTPIIDGTYPNSTISSSPTMIIANVQNFGAITGTVTNIGGIIGQASYSSITNAGNTGEIRASSANGYAGGIIGNNYKSNCDNIYNYGTIIALSAGSLVGSITQNAKINGYYLTTIPSTAPIGKISTDVIVDDTTLPLSAEQFKLETSFTNWDFINIWQILTNADYPILR